MTSHLRPRDDVTRACDVARARVCIGTLSRARALACEPLDAPHSASAGDNCRRGGSR